MAQKSADAAKASAASSAKLIDGLPAGFFDNQEMNSKVKFIIRLYFCIVETISGNSNCGKAEKYRHRSGQILQRNRRRRKSKGSGRRCRGIIIITRILIIAI